MALTFSRVARKVSNIVGTSTACLVAMLIVIAWACTGSFFNYSDTWQLIINTGTTIITFLMVFLIQNAQNHDARAIQAKLDELIRAVRNADNTLINIEEKTEEEIQSVKETLKKECK